MSESLKAVPDLPSSVRVGYIIGILLRGGGLLAFFAAYDIALHGSVLERQFVTLVKEAAGSRAAVVGSWALSWAMVVFLVTRLQHLRLHLDIIYMESESAASIDLNGGKDSGGGGGVVVKGGANGKQDSTVLTRRPVPGVGGVGIAVNGANGVPDAPAGRGLGRLNPAIAASGKRILARRALARSATARW